MAGGMTCPAVVLRITVSGQCFDRNQQNGPPCSQGERRNVTFTYTLLSPGSKLYEFLCQS